MATELFSNQSEAPAETDALLRRFFGIIVLLFGVGVGIWLLSALVSVLAADSTPGLVTAVVPDANKPVVLGLPEGKFTLPREVFVPIGYLLVCFVYAIAAGLAAVLINGGVSLLQPDLAKVLRKLAERLERK
jgi:hypothetical protein